MRFLDTNIIIRYLTRDNEIKAARCFELFQKLKANQEKVTTCEAIITEVVYVLSSKVTYNLTPEEIRSRLAPIINLRGLKLRSKRIYLKALDVYVENPSFDFEDAIAVAYMERSKLDQIYSYDTDFDNLATVSRIEP